MAEKKRHVLVVEVTPGLLRVCSPAHSEPEVLEFGDLALVDMEVPKPGELSEKIKAFFTEKKITNFDIVIVFAESLCFEIDLTPLPITEQDITYDRFVETVPMEAVMARRFQLDDKQLVGVAVNRNTYEFFKSSLSLSGLTVIAAVPSIAAKQLGYNQQLTSSACALLNKRLKQLTAYSFFSDVTKAAAFAPGQRKVIGQHQILFGGISLVCVAIALVTSVYTLRRQTPPPKVIPVIAAENSPTPTIEIVPTEIPTKTADLKVSLVNQSGKNAAVQDVREKLIEIGVTNIALSSANNNRPITQVGFGNRVSLADKQTIRDYLEGLFGAVEIIETPDINIDVYIVVGTNLKTTP